MMASQKGGLAILGVLVLVAILLSSSGGFTWQGIQLPDLGFGGTGLTDVNKQLKFHFIYEYGGDPIASKSNTFEIWDATGSRRLESALDTDANGHCTTGSDYASGTNLQVRYESSNDKMWWNIVVPQMTPADAESATYNLIRLSGFTIGTYTDALKLANGTALADDGTYDISIDGNTAHMIYSIANTGADNTGLMTSSDPVYDQRWDVELYVTFSGTDYEKLIIYDLAYDFTLGTTHYVGKTLDPYALTKHKEGNTYLSLGADEVSFWIDCSGAGGSASVTMYISVRAYADHNYAMNHGGTFGAEAVEICETTLTIQA
jgi:hypothetical protein